ncbi:MAG: tRNA pseudouridine(13) synthase TruD [Phycisphaerales bacterium]|nr:tRNA pseudouridine(13) synthase TruD [Phycisphaerae bacterium]NNF45096.1 tRNA pseudouridine(13) synthase TruD [Phycisphaerales bacterium]NNM25138.1 tRNA pseudouridine(13) synthase TruD [Phycisphaerales bacterium]
MPHAFRGPSPPFEADDPLPRRYLTGDSGIGGRIKVRPEDFVVEEIPLYEPDDTGEHLYLRIQKRGVAHGELMSCLRRQFGVSERAIGYAGMKDKHAVTRQTVSIHLIDDPPEVAIPHERIDVLWAARHRNKIRRGHLRGNRFSIRIRDVDPTRAPAALRTLRRLETSGCPAYFGAQRFGYRHNNHRLGLCLVQGDWQAALDELLGAGGSPFPEYQRTRREQYDAGAFDEAAAAWTAADRSERIAAGTLARGRTPKEAIRAIGGTTLRFWSSALVSSIFNRLLDTRIEEDAVGRLVAGDLAWKHDSRAVFAVTDELAAEAELADRLTRLEISPSGPLWGPNMTRAGGVVDAQEQAALAACGLTPADVERGEFHADGARRPFRTPIANADGEGGFDDHGPYVRLAFDLPRGMYATVVLREIMKDDGVEPSGG